MGVGATQSSRLEGKETGACTTREACGEKGAYGVRGAYASAFALAVQSQDLATCAGYSCLVHAHLAHGLHVVRVYLERGLGGCEAPRVLGAEDR